MITAVVCSDDRMRYVCKSLHMEMEIIAIDEDSDFLTLPRLDAIILPVKGIDDEGYMKLYDSLVHVPSMFWQIQKKASDPRSVPRATIGKVVLPRPILTE